jgi:uncharacterized repeat protein (TIGR01451 family)
MQTNRKLLALAIVGTGLFTVAIARAGTGADNNGLFELDGNVADNPATPGADWSTVYSDIVNGTKTSGAIVTSFITDPVSGAENSFFTGGGSKDVNDVPDWLYGIANDVVPDKDDLEHVFTALYEKADCYVPPGGGACVNETHSFFYFGADRFDSGDGSAQVGFWFFKSPVSLNPPPARSTTGSFNGVHTVGDLLVLLDFNKGGSIADMNVYKWVGGKNPLLNIYTSASPASVDCSQSTGPVCETINAVGGETPPWPYDYNLGNPPTQHYYDPLSFVEAGIDVTYLLGGDIGCFSSFLAETRSSGSSTTAQLKDFALGDFGVCKIAAQKTGPSISKAGDTITYTVSVTNTGRKALYLYSATDTLGGALVTNGVKAAGVGGTCSGSLATGATCTLTYPYTVKVNDPDPLKNVVTVVYREAANLQGIDFTSTAQFTTNLFLPSVSVSKSGDTIFANGYPVNYSFTIRNTSSSDTPALVLDSVVDSVIGPLSPPASCTTLAPGDQCTFTATRTALATDPDALTNTVTVNYHPTGFPNVVQAQDSHTANRFNPSLSVGKSGPPKAKVGDRIQYNYTITNTSSANTPALTLVSVSDDKLGDLASYLPASCGTLAAGASCSFSAPWTVAGTADPITNTVTAVYSPTGYATITVTGTKSFDLNVFQPSIEFGKSVDKPKSKVGDTVTYTLALNNTSSPDTPDLACTITDAKLGVNKSVTLSSGAMSSTPVTYTILSTDPDPLDNMASVSCQVTGWPNTLSKSASARVDLFQPSVQISKTVSPAVSKLGDTVTYTFTITNNGSADAPNLSLQGISDDVIGDLKATAMTAAAGCGSLAPGASCHFSVSWVVQSTDPTVTTIVNNVMVHYKPDGFTNDISAHASATLALFSPSFTMSKTADKTLSKVGDSIHYTIIVTNTSTPAGVAPNLVCTIADAKLGITKTVTLAAGQSEPTTPTYTVQASDTTPLVNTATVTCSPAGHPNVLTDSKQWSVNLFNANISLAKTGPAYSKPGDTARYTVTLTNNSGANTPDLSCTVTDSLLGTLGTATFTAGSPAQTVFNASYTVPTGTATSLTNTATAQCSIAGFPNTLSKSSSVTTTLLNPSLAANEVCAYPSGKTFFPINGPAIFTLGVTDTGNADLVISASEDNAHLGGALAHGASKVGSFVVAGPFNGVPSVSNSLTVNASLATAYGLPNTYSANASAMCAIGGQAKVIKTANLLPPTGSAAYTFQLRQGASPTADGSTLDTETANAANGGMITFGADLAPGQHYQICEIIAPGWASSFATFVPGSFQPPNGVAPNPNVDNSIVCGDFVAVGGQVQTFNIDNVPPPGGNALTIGYWKNWSSCTKGKQKYTLDYTLGKATLPGIQVGAFYLKGVTVDSLDAVVPSADCSKAVSLLNKSDYVTGKKMASDPLYNMVAQMVAAELNYTSGAYSCTVITSDIAQANALLVKYGFTGTGSYAKSMSQADAALANKLGAKLDDYNNDRWTACQP